MTLCARFSRFRTSFRFKLFLIFTLLTALVSGLFSTLYVFREIQQQKEFIADKLRLQTQQLADGIRLPLYAENIAVLRQLAEQAVRVPETCSIRIATPSGKVLTDISVANDSGPTHRISKSIEVRSTPLIGSPEVALSGSQDVSALIGTVRIERGTEEMTRNIREEIVVACGATFAFWLAMFGLGYLALRRVTRSFNALVRGVEIMQTGDYGVRIDDEHDDEPGRIAHSINGLAAALQQREAENERLHEELVNAMRLEAREEKQRVMARLIETNRMTSLGLLASSMAHEINTPNGAIRLAGAYLSRSWNDARPLLQAVAVDEGDFCLGGLPFSSADSEITERFATIERNTVRIDSIVTHLRSYSLGDRQLFHPDVDLNRVVSRSLVIIRSHGTHFAAISTDLALDLPLITGSHGQLEQVLVNLLLNACLAVTDGAGTIVVATSYNRETGRVIVTVSDTGIGIPPEHMEQIMEPFFSTRIDSGGSGLGLYISRFIVSEHNGSMEFSSSPGNGTTVTVSFPLNPNSDQSRNQGAEAYK